MLLVLVVRIGFSQMILCRIVGLPREGKHEPLADAIDAIGAIDFVE
jgi:hypothetical protein